MGNCWQLLVICFRPFQAFLVEHRYLDPVFPVFRLYPVLLEEPGREVLSEMMEHRCQIEIEILNRVTRVNKECVEASAYFFDTVLIGNVR